MTSSDLVVAAVLLATVLLGLPVARATWRGAPTGLPQTPYGWWLFSDALWRGGVRAYGVSVLLAATAEIVWLSSTVASAPWADALSLVFSALAAVVLLPLAAGIVLVNRPKWLVPPGLRAQPGWLEEIRGRGAGAS